MTDHTRIRPIAISILRRGAEILVFEDHDAHRDLTYYRPLGGGIRFGETSESAVRRELREEIRGGPRRRFADAWRARAADRQ